MTLFRVPVILATAAAVFLSAACTERPTLQAPGYRLARPIEGVTAAAMLGFAMFPDSDDEAVVVTQFGELWRISVSGAFPMEPFGNLSSFLIRPPSSEEGLLGFAFSPTYAEDGYVYVYYTADGPRRSVLARFSVVNGVMAGGSQEVLLEVEQPRPHHNGGQLAFGPDGYLYVGLGDGGGNSDPDLNGQNLEMLLATILRIDVSGEGGYTIPPDNPFVGQEGAREEIYAYGLRNPWRFSFDRETGDLWVGDVGEGRWEEVNRVEAGGNYGWSILEGHECLREPNCDRTGLIPPRAVYGRDDGCAIIGGHVYRGKAMPELSGWYIYGDHCTGNVWALNTEDESEPVLLTRGDVSISSWGELPNGELVAVTFRQEVLHLERAE